MAKTLSFTDTSPQTVKIGDTTTSFSLICGNDNVATDLTKATSITAKLGNASGYLKSATIDPTKLTDPTTGQITITFNADLMTSLPAGAYSIEVWVVDSTGTSIYPSDGSTGFAITNNIQSTNGATITTITFDDFVNKFNTSVANVLANTTDTTNWQKSAITASDGEYLHFISTGSSLTSQLQKLVATGASFSTVLVDYRVPDSPTTNALRGWLNCQTGIGSGLFFDTDSDRVYTCFITSSSVKWYQVPNDSTVLHLSTGDTASRPTSISAGYQYFDTSLNKPVWYTGKGWVDATGTTV